MIAYNMNMYYGPTDYKIFKKYDRNLDEAMPLGWGIFGLINRYVIIPLVWIFKCFLPSGIAIIVMTILIKLIAVSCSVQIIFISSKNEGFKTRNG